MVRSESVKDRVKKSGAFGQSTARRAEKLSLPRTSREQSRGSSRAVFLAEEGTRAKDRKLEVAKDKLGDALTDYITELSLAHYAFEAGSSNWYSVTESNRRRLELIDEKGMALASSRQKTERAYSKVCGATGDAYKKFGDKTASAMKKAGASSPEIRAKKLDLDVKRQQVYTHNREKMIALYEKHTVEIRKLIERIDKMKK